MNHIIRYKLINYKWSCKVYIDNVLPVFHWHCKRKTVACNSCIVNKNVKTARSLKCTFNTFFKCSSISTVTANFMECNTIVRSTFFKFFFCFRRFSTKSPNFTTVCKEHLNDFSSDTTA